MCGIVETCAKYFSKMNSFSSFVQASDPVYLNASSGYSKIVLDYSIRLGKGSIMVVSYTTSARLGTESENINEGNIDYSDYLISGTPGAYTLSRINPTKNVRFLINTLIDSGFYKDVIKLAKTYDFFISYDLTLKLSNSSLFMKLSIDFKNSMIFL